MTKVLIVDDEESICWGLSKLCEQMSLTAVTASSAEKGLELAKTQSIDVIILDVRLPGMDGLQAIAKFHELLGPVPIMTITAFGDLRTAIEAIQNGAFEYIVKPFELDAVKKTLSQAVAASKMTSTTSADNASGDESLQKTGLVGKSKIIQEVYKQIALTTTTRTPVLLTGESGTGKELAARSIHEFGPRSGHPFVAVNIASLNPALAESELFGHVKGAFTGADVARSGLIEQANGGTLFLDEIAEVPLEIQVKLLRVLDLGEVTPVGSNSALKVDFRLITATHQDLLSQVNHGEFRHDLYYRISAFEIRLPPLRHRKDDIPELIRFFLDQDHQTSTRVSQSFIDALQNHRWPGNVRELRSVVEKAATLARGGVLTADHFDRDAAAMPVFSEADTAQAIRSLVKQWTEENWDLDSDVALYEKLLSVIESGILPAAFELAEGQYSSAARRLGIHRTTLKKKLDEFEL